MGATNDRGESIAYVENANQIRRDKTRLTNMLSDLTWHARVGRSINYEVTEPHYLDPVLNRRCVLEMDEEKGRAHYLQVLKDGLNKITSDGTFPEGWENRKDIPEHVRNYVEHRKQVAIQTVRNFKK